MRTYRAKAIIMTIFLLSVNSGHLAGKAEPRVIRFQTGSLATIMEIEPLQVTESGTLRDGNKIIAGFRGVSRLIRYRLVPQSGTLTKRLRVREVLQVLEQNYRTETELLSEKERTLPVAADGTFSDLIALGTNDGSAFPADFHQIVRQSLYLIDDEVYRDGRLLGVLRIDRGTTDIQIGLLWPSATSPDSVSAESVQWSSEADRPADIAKSREYAAEEIRAGHYQRAIEIYKRLIDELANDARYERDLAVIWTALANVYNETGQLQQAEQCLHKAEKILRHLPDSKVELAVVLSNLAGIYRIQGQIATADRLEKKNKEVIISSLRKLSAMSTSPSETARAYNSICVLYLTLKQLTQAKKYCDQSLLIRQGIANADIDLGETTMNEAAIENLQGKPTKALMLGLKALALLEGQLGQSNPGLVLTLDNIGRFCAAARDFECAEKYFSRSLSIREQSSFEPLAIARSLNSLAEIYMHRGDYNKAQPLLARAVDIKRAQSTKDEEFVKMLSNYSSVLKAERQFAEAQKLTAEMNGVQATLRFTLRARP
jgi:tetratricopeptide (TPR) repeat protein